MDLTAAAINLLEPLGYEVLECTVANSARRPQVLLRIDRFDEKPVTMDDVTEVTEVFGLELDRLDPFPNPYNLSVESPGSTRPLFTARHFERFHGLLAKVRVGDETFTGRTLRVEDDTVTFDVDGTTRTLSLAEIGSARLAEWPDTPR